MQKIFILRDGNVEIYGERLYHDTVANFILDGGKKLSADFIEYNQTLKTLRKTIKGKDSVVVGNAQDTVLDGYLKDIATFVANKEKREYVEPTLEEVKASKVQELKTARDTAEVENVVYNGHEYDFDEKSRDRLDIALKALNLQGEGTTIGWTMADNTIATITAQDIVMVFATSAVRSNELHEKYRGLKEKVNACTIKEDVEKIKF